MKKNNQGFSMVELIIVMAIMAILVGVLAPQYMKYVERSRKSADVKTIDEIEKAALLTAEETDEYDLSLSCLKEGEYLITYSNCSFTGLTGPEQKSADVLKKGIESFVGELANIQLKHSGWGTVQIHMNVSSAGVMTTSCTSSGRDSYEEYISK